MVCLTADGDVTVRALMEAILFWQSSGDLFAWEDTDEQEDREMTHRSTVNRLHLVPLTEGFRIAPSKKAFVSRTHDPLHVYKVSYNPLKTATDPPPQKYILYYILL